jgi:hypothetical protein
MIFWLVLKVEISYTVMTSWRILVSFRGYFLKIIFLHWWNILKFHYSFFASRCFLIQFKWQGHSVAHPLFDLFMNENLIVINIIHQPHHRSLGLPLCFHRDKIVVAPKQAERSTKEKWPIKLGTKLFHLKGHTLHTTWGHSLKFWGKSSRFAPSSHAVVKKL